MFLQYYAEEEGGWDAVRFTNQQALHTVVQERRLEVGQGPCRECADLGKGMVKSAEGLA